MRTPIFIAMIFLTACASPPVATEFEKSRSYGISKNEAFDKVVEYFATNNVQIKTISKESGLIAAEPSFIDISHANCGGTGLYKVVRTGGLLNVFVKGSGDGSTVSVNTVFRQERIFDRNKVIADCLSTGGLEANILNAISE